ncbi:hypothetical protein [Microbacterium sp. HM-570]
MQANRRRDTRPELALRSPLHAAGHRYRMDHRIDFPGARVRPTLSSRGGGSQCLSTAVSCIPVLSTARSPR